MYRRITIILFLIFFFGFGFGQVPIDDIVEDKNEMADAYYGTFKYQGQAYTGNVVAYYENGKIKTLRSFKDGKYHGFWTEWYPNGNRKFQGDRKENKGHGLTKWWHENGQLKKQGTYDMDKQQGVVVQWYENGSLQQIRHYDQDQAFGGWTTFDKNGEVWDEGDDNNLFYRPFFGNDVAPSGFEETSPSFTSDGKTMVFARYDDWVKKVPYIAHLKDGRWHKEQLSITDTLYNLAINNQGDKIVFKRFEVLDREEISRTYISEKSGDEWQAPIEVNNLFNINAGYFDFTSDGTLFMFARKPKTGIYYSLPDEDEMFTKPIWLSDDVSLDISTSFDAVVNDEKNKLIVTQEYQRKRQSELGNIGMYYYEKQGEKWQRIKRIPVGYGWGAEVVGNKFVFVRNGNIQYISLDDIEIN